MARERGLRINLCKDNQITRRTGDEGPRVEIEIRERESYFH